ncbi:MAG: hypothetical protein N2558_00640 [Patescibacteria group bacterium]|nr:hypothetical protein [Patescibacteria group bacterium]
MIDKIAKYFLILLGTIVWSLTMVKSGLVYDYGMGFWGANGHDAIWHISLAESIAKGSKEMPIYSGEEIKNYHLGFSFLVATIHNLTKIPIINIYFHILPPVLAFFIGFLAYKFVFEWKKSHGSAMWAVFFVYFGGSWGWLVGFFRTGNFGGESMFWSQQGISTLINPPFALSLILMLLALIFANYGIARNNKLSLFLASIIFGFLVQIKAYSGLLVVFGFVVSSLYMAFFSRKYFLLPFSFFSLAILFIFLIPFLGKESTFIWQPFWFLESMVALSDRLGWDKYYSAMTNYRLSGDYLKVALAYGIAFIIFFVGNSGTRILGVWEIMKSFRNLTNIDWISVFVFSILIVGTVIPTFFVQIGTPWNSIQFFYYSIFFLGILSGIAFSNFLENVRVLLIKVILSIVLIFLTLPTTIFALNQYLPDRPPAKLSIYELEALSFLALQEDGVVLTYPFDRQKAYDAMSNPPRPLYLYESTAYVSAFSKKPTFLEDEVNLDITNFNWRQRRKMVEDFLLEDEADKAQKFLKDNNIKYIYWIKGQRARLGESQLGIYRIFENQEVDIYKVSE